MAPTLLISKSNLYFMQPFYRKIKYILFKNAKIIILHSLFLLLIQGKNKKVNLSFFSFVYLFIMKYDIYVEIY